MTINTLFNNGSNFPRDKVQSIFKDLYDVTLNEQTLQAQNEFAYGCLATDDDNVEG